MSRSSRFTTAAAVLGLLGASAFVAPAAAQITANASVNATAFVSGVAPLTAAGVNDLNFGTVAAGAVKTPTSLSADAGRYNVSGQPSTPVTITFNLPTVLTGPGASTIPITFNATDGLIWTSFPTTFTTFSPNAPFVSTLSAGGSLVVGISGTVSPPVLTSTGTYTGTVQMTVSY